MEGINREGNIERGTKEPSKKKEEKKRQEIRNPPTKSSTEHSCSLAMAMGYPWEKKKTGIAMVLLLPLLLLLSPATGAAEADPTPEPWPEQFHALLFMNYSNELSTIDLWYDWPGGRNLNLIREQLGRGGPALWDVEWNNGTSFFYTLQAPLSCRSAQLDVGILRRDWLDGAAYLGRAHVDGFLCDEWTKADFIWYYQDVCTLRPVKWVFYTGRTAHVMSFEVGAVLSDEAWQAPPYCFPQNQTHDATLQLHHPQTFPFSVPDNNIRALTINQNLIQRRHPDHTMLPTH